MRCLGIPNTAHFANITSIEDASQLWEKLRVTREMERFRPENQVNKSFILKNWPKYLCPPWFYNSQYDSYLNMNQNLESLSKSKLF